MKDTASHCNLINEEVQRVSLTSS